MKWDRESVNKTVIFSACKNSHVMFSEITFARLGSRDENGRFGRLYFSFYFEAAVFISQLYVCVRVHQLGGGCSKFGIFFPPYNDLFFWFFFCLPC